MNTSAQQSTSRVLMIQPFKFHGNKETRKDNFFQGELALLSEEEVHTKAMYQFQGLCEVLKKEGVEVMVFPADMTLDTPDAIFPNNWFSTHADNTFVLYPMRFPSRRLERREDIIQYLRKNYSREFNLAANEHRNLFLEGTGSLVLDRINNVAYASLSERTSEALVKEWANYMGCEALIFKSYDKKGEPIYHTNVMMAVGTGYVVVCAEAVRDIGLRDNLLSQIKKVGYEIIEITLTQLEYYCGNSLELIGLRGRRLLIMSNQALDHFTEKQLAKFNSYAKIVSVDLSIIERLGGGSARCMLAELF